MKDINCAYCGNDEVLAGFGMFICSLPVSRVYLFKEQSHKGRCIVAYKEHIGDITELDNKDIAGYYQDIAKVSRALYEIFIPDKINYGVYGDTAKHIHTHLVPKYKDKFEWGGVFAMNPDNVYLTDTEYAEIIEQIRAVLRK
ncbi:HIT family protein [Pectinatus frisingensis]|uniref:HIT family protein n=1 Tax=Pectinatus frisingensis TaxID=865 RepID=UPI0015F4EA00|nr:HIT family protein [Pectinatus frisingensis]